ncbi:hypothetical protein SEMRO_1596_G284800.1 [Seminavis robusta]|uniref:Uncharacterized protein n=1 Tax=Seminavis robusta TaxID=568900 RepID=A0A9N8HT09_9STRA|nr:hypothetical protein SEMRO_1596_G284800.1 [Seminavis robusta]|eukprot:Sro1596_g284800.1 n/a (202) ;mRNA; f:13586-14191
MNLVQAVTSTVGASQLSLQNTTNQHLADVKKTLGTLQDGMATESKSVMKAIEELGSKTSSLEKAVTEEAKAVCEADKMRRLEFALQNISIVAKDFIIKYAQDNGQPSSGYHSYRYSSRSENAETLFRDILLAFRRNLGYYITNYYSVVPSGSYDEGRFKSTINQEWCKAFQDKLVLKLHSLLGKKPVITTDNGGRIIISYE